MIASLLRLTGLDRKLEELKRDLHSRADTALDHLKAVAVQLALSAGLVIGAGLFALLALITGLIAVYVWAEARWGTFVALGIIGGSLVVIAALLLLAGLSVARSKSQAARRTTAAVPAQVPAQQLPAPATALAAPQPHVLRAEQANMVEPFLSLVSRYAHMPKTGVEPIDQLLGQMQPRAAVAADEAVRRAAALVQTGDRTTMIAILGAATALGWLMVQSADKKSAGL
jgi:hypothetical protein